MGFTPNLVLQLHRDLFQFALSSGGKWKVTDNKITETRPDGTEVVRFTPVSPVATPDAMAALHDRVNARWDAGNFEPLLLIPAYVLDFLCIHPFLVGNGRMARLLTLLLLYRAGYEVGRYISLEALVEQTKDGYYGTLYASSQRWHEAQHTLVPWWEYFLGVMLLTVGRILPVCSLLAPGGTGADVGSRPWSPSARVSANASAGSATAPPAGSWRGTSLDGVASSVTGQGARMRAPRPRRGALGSPRSGRGGWCGAQPRLKKVVPRQENYGLGCPSSHSTTSWLKWSDTAGPWPPPLMVQSSAEPPALQPEV